LHEVDGVVRKLACPKKTTLGKTPAALPQLGVFQTHPRQPITEPQKKREKGTELRHAVIPYSMEEMLTMVRYYVNKWTAGPGA